MASRSRSVSPVGASRFEAPYTLPARQPSTAKSHPNKIMAYQYQHQHQRDISKSTWSDTSETSTPRDYSTAPSSAQQSPVDAMSARHKETEPWVHHQHHYEHEHQHHDEDSEHTGPDEWYAHCSTYSEDGYGDECPDQATLAAVNDIVLYSTDGIAIPFGSLYSPDTAVNQRQLFIFVRHFYCGACQAYLKAITQGISLQDYFSIPIPTSIIVIGCGSPNLIPFYKAVTGTPFPVFAEPSRQLYKKLGMVLSGNIGKERPEYMKDVSAPAWLTGQVKTVREGLRARRKVRKMSRMTQGFDLLSDNASPRTSTSASGGSSRQGGSSHHDDGDDGETTIRRQAHDQESHLAALALRKRDLIRGGNMFQIGGEFLFEDGEVIWCHRMRHYRDHVEVSDVRKLLELDE